MQAFSHMRRTGLVLRAASQRSTSLRPVAWYSSKADELVHDMGTDEKQATGLEKIELDAIAEGKEVYGESVLRGPFGTPENPVIVQSVFHNRIVGCVGGKHNEHELIWHNVSHEKPLVCLECGQVFKLERIEDPALAEAHH
mmetsp:Transcript_62168/g.86417  ORF Transcript_62168/g.86417 Transcript_62168/m.86417 type:complete len:141 (+) Transcript_62168:69-491(+)